MKTIIGLALVLLAVQFVRPKLNNPPAVAELQAPPAVKQVLKQSCYACHSNERRLSWFDEIVPAYWIVAHDVRKARLHLNFSELGARSVAEQRAKLFEAVNFMQKGEMPLKDYTRLHSEATVTQAQINVLREYLHPVAAIESAKAAAVADEEYCNWIKSLNKPVSVRPSPNGIDFQPDYKDWKLIGSTARFDTNSFRVILGNGIALKAIADNDTNPWPDGTAFAKVGWLQKPDQQGLVQAGAFLKVGFMIKNKAKFASSAGWGWAEWVGSQLKPYGEGPGFAAECVSCHTPLRKSDYVFTMPIQFAKGPRSTLKTGNDFNVRATITGDIPVNPLNWSVITCGTNPREATISTLFGNDTAVLYARTHSDGRYPAGSMLSLVTWQQQEDNHWFGANMPAETKSVEVVAVKKSGRGRLSYSYQDFEGSPLKTVTKSASWKDGRTAYITSQRAAVMP
jgi:mono/diheme cytochrome c family protein